MITGQVLQNWFSGASASDLSSWASDAAGSGWGNSWASRFSLSTNDAASIAAWSSWERAALISILNELSAAKAYGGLTFDFGDYTVDGFHWDSSVTKTKWVLHTDWTQIGAGFYLTSLWWTRQ